MLTNQYKPDDVISVKMVNGDEYVAKFVSEDMISFVVKRPLALVPTPQGIAMTDAMFSIDRDRTCKIAKHAIMIHDKTRKDVADGYIESTTGIKVATNSLQFP